MLISSSCREIQKDSTHQDDIRPVLQDKESKIEVIPHDKEAVEVDLFGATDEEVEKANEILDNLHKRNK